MKMFDVLLSTPLDTGLLVFGWAYFLCYLPFVLLGIKAPYGKFTERPDINLPGFTLPAAAGWMLQECPALLLPLAAMASHISLGAWSTDKMDKLVKLATFAAHYANRTLIFPWSMKKRVPLLICMSAFFFCSYNGFMQSHAILLQADGVTPAWRMVAGLSVFISGMAVNISSDRRLQNLRGPGQTGYVIPHGGLFRWLSCPNYSGEVMEWWGFALLAGTPAAWWFACWTSLFLGSRALQTHRYYKEKFKEDYPADRKAVLPFIL